MNFEIAYLPIGVPTFHLESAGKEFEKSVTLLKEIDASITVPDEMLLSIDKLHAFMDTIQPDLVVVQNITFANGAYMTEILRRFDCPVMLWTLREPVIDGGRLRLNSLTGAYSAANMLAAFDRPFSYCFGSPEEESVKRNILGPTWETDAISLKNSKQNVKKLLNICHNYLSKAPKSDHKS